MIERLTASDWLEQGLRTLADDGPGGLKVGPMAASLSVSRGSFYWHFRDLADFKDQLLRLLQDRTTDQTIRDIETNAAEPDRLAYLLRRAFGPPHRLDRALRAWAVDDAEVAMVVAAADADKIAYIASLLIAAGIDPLRARSRAAFLLFAYLGQNLAPGAERMNAASLDDIGHLFET